MRAGIGLAIDNQRAADSGTYSDVEKRRLFAAGAETGLRQGSSSDVGSERDAAMNAQAGAYAVGTPVQRAVALDLLGRTHQLRNPDSNSVGAQTLRFALRDDFAS